MAAKTTVLCNTETAVSHLIQSNSWREQAARCAVHSATDDDNDLSLARMHQTNVATEDGCLKAFPARSADACRIALLAAALICSAAVNAGPNAHTHGRLALDAAIDPKSITLQIDAPLDNFLPFERAPANAVERRSAAQVIAQLRAAEQLFEVDPASGCALSTVSLQSEALALHDGEGLASTALSPSLHGAPNPSSASHSNALPDETPSEHADIDMTVVFSCRHAQAARFINIKMFQSFKRLRVIDAQVASDQGEFKRTLTPASPRLRWGR